MNPQTLKIKTRHKNNFIETDTTWLDLICTKWPPNLKDKNTPNLKTNNDGQGGHYMKLTRDLNNENDIRQNTVSTFIINHPCKSSYNSLWSLFDICCNCRWALSVFSKWVSRSILCGCWLLHILHRLLHFFHHHQNPWLVYIVQHHSCSMAKFILHKKWHHDWWRLS